MPKRVLILGSAVGGGDWPPLAAAGLALHKFGHGVTCVADRFLVSDRGSPPLSMISLPDGIELSAYIDRWKMRTGVSHSLPPMADAFLEWARDALGFVLRAVHTLKPHVILCNDTTLPLGIKLRECTKIPLWVLNSTFRYSQSSSCRLENDFADCAVSWVRWLLNLMQRADLLIHATDPIFDPPASFGSGEQPEYCVGPLFWERPDRPIPAYLKDTQNSWVLVSLSSARQEGELTLATIAAKILPDFFVDAVITLADPDADASIMAACPRVHVETYVPHSYVLPHARLTISHAGHGTVLKSLYHGVPLVLVPWGRDQPGVAARARSIGVASIILKQELHEIALATAVQEVLTNPAYRTRAQWHSRRMQSDDSDEMIANLVEKLA